MAQPLSFSSTFSEAGLKVFEVTDDILKDLLANNGSIRGDPSDKAVLCTKNHTYSIRHLDSSNTLLFFPKESKTVIGQSSGYFELQSIEPSLSILKTLLQDSVHEETVFGDEPPEKKKLYRWDELRAKVQMSDGELKSALRRMGVFKDKHKRLRILGNDLRMNLMEMILVTVKTLGWSLDDKFSLSKLYEAVSDYPSTQVKACARMYSKDSQVGSQMAFDPAKVAIFRAEQVLRNTPKHSLRIGDFKTQWEEAMEDECDVLKKAKVELTLDLLRDFVTTNDGMVQLRP